MADKEFFDDEYAFDVFENDKKTTQVTDNSKRGQKDQENPNDQDMYNPYDSVNQKSDDLIKQVQLNYKLDDFEMEHFREEMGCIHEICAPKGWVSKEKPNTPPAKEYKFTLDPFQKTAIDCLEKHESV